MNLPDFDGIALLTAMRERCPCKAVAIAVSADAMPHVVEKAPATGFSQYWTKSLDVEQTLVKLEEATRARWGCGSKGARVDRATESQTGAKEDRACCCSAPTYMCQQV